MPEVAVVIVIMVGVVVVVAAAAAAAAATATSIASGSRTDVISSFTLLSLRSVVGSCSYVCPLHFAL